LRSRDPKRPPDDHIIVSKEPACAGIDPDHKLIERKGRDNLVSTVLRVYPEAAAKDRDETRRAR
jgi:hypothetical protein